MLQRHSDLWLRLLWMMRQRLQSIGNDLGLGLRLVLGLGLGLGLDLIARRLPGNISREK